MKKLIRFIAIILTGMAMLASCSKEESLQEKIQQEITPSKSTQNESGNNGNSDNEGNQTSGQNAQGAGG